MVESVSSEGSKNSEEENVSDHNYVHPYIDCGNQENETKQHSKNQFLNYYNYLSIKFEYLTLEFHIILLNTVEWNRDMVTQKLSKQTCAP